MKKLLLLLLPLSFVLFSCEKKIDPVVYNDSLVKYSEDAEKRLMDLDVRIDAFFDSEKFTAEGSAQLAEDLKTVKDSITSDLNKIKIMEKPGNAEEFHNSTIKYVESLISQIDTYKEQYSKLSNDISDDDLMKMDEIINKTLEDTQTKLDEMIKAQTVFAKANNIQLTTESLN